MRRFFKWMYEISFSLHDWWGRKLYKGKPRKNFKFRIEYQLGIKRGRAFEKERIISVMTYHENEAKTVKKMITLLKNLP